MAAVPAPAPAAVDAATKQTLLVSHKQKGNPLLALLRHCFWVYADLPVGDFCTGDGVIAFFLSLRFHALKPLYLPRRLAELAAAGGGAGSTRPGLRLRILLVLVDVEDPVRALQSVTLAALDAGLTLVCAWSPAEAARYLETFKAYDGKGAAAIQERVGGSFLLQATDALTAVRGVNRTDVLTLLSRFGGTLAGVLRAGAAELGECPGVGEKKVRRLHEAFSRPFLPPPPRAAAAAAAVPDDPAGAAEVEGAWEWAAQEGGGGEGGELDEGGGDEEEPPRGGGGGASAAGAAAAVGDASTPQQGAAVRPR